jgi:hypothetical protein
MHLSSVGVAQGPMGEDTQAGGGKAGRGGRRREGAWQTDKKTDAARKTEEDYSSIMDSRRWAFRAHLNVMAFSWNFISGRS